MRTTTTSAIPVIAEPTAAAHGALHSLAFRFIGLAIASLLPAVFWGGILELVCKWLGAPLSLSALELITGAIALFLFAVCAPIMLRSGRTEPDAQLAFVRRRQGQGTESFSLSSDIQLQMFRRDA